MKWTKIVALAGVLTFTLLGCDESESPTDPLSPPDAPAEVTSVVEGTDLTVSWSSVSGADSYRVEVETTGEAERVETTTDLQITFAGLTEGVTYVVQVFAVNGDGEEGSSVQTVLIEESVVIVNSDVLTNTTWTADKVWVLTQPIFVGRDCGADGAAENCVEATLTIEPGTTVLGRTDVAQGIRGAYLVVSRGSRLVADANADRADPNAKPDPDDVIVFTSDRPRGQRASEDWGGLIVNGRAPTNSGDEAQGEGDSGFYGGPDVNDDSGVLRGVRIEFAGDDVTPVDQLNGLALQGVGAGTTVSYVQIHYNKDDGIEPFGGTVSVDHLVVSGIGDDSVDGTDGYRGFMQFIIGQQRGADADQGMELSNNGDDGAASPRTSAVVANATMIGAREGRVDGQIAGPESDNALELREGSSYRVLNSIFTGFGTSGLCIRDAQSIVNAQNRLAGDDDPASTLRAEGLIMWNNGGAADEDTNFAACGGGSSQALNKEFFEEPAFNNMLADPGFASSAFDLGEQTSPPDFTLAAMPDGYTPADVGGIAFDDTNLIAPLDGRTLVATDYAGAVEPGTSLAEAWYSGWTVWTTSGSDSRPNHEGN